MRELPKVARERLAAGPAPAPHLDSNLIAAFVEYALLPGERQQVIAHMAVCEDCRAQVQLVTSATRSEAQNAEAVRDVTAESASRSRGFSWPRLSWQRLLRWQPIAAAAGVLVITLAFWVATRQPMSVRLHPAAPTTLATKAEPPSSPADNAGPAAARLQPPAPSSEAKHKLARALQSSPESSSTNNSDMLKSSERRAATEVAGRLVSDKTQSPERLEAQARPTGALAVAAPPPPAPAPAASATASKSAPAAVQGVVVSVQAEAAPARGVAPAPASLSMRAENFAAKAARAPRPSALAGTEPAMRWAVTAAAFGQANQGAVEKSLDGGRTWQPVPVAKGVTFRVAFALGRDVWAGGAAGALYHSSDGGEHWSAAPLATSSVAPTGDIVSIQFADAAHGVVSTSSGQKWTTSDHGRTWQPQ